MSGTFSLVDFIAAENTLYQQERRGLGRWDARLKLGLCTAAVLANVFFAKAALSAILGGVAVTGLLFSRVPYRQALLFVFAPLWATMLVVFGFAWGFGSTVWLRLGPLTLHVEGLWMGLNAGLRVFAEMSWMAALVLTTPFGEILAALRWYRVSPIFTDLLASMYRYIFLLFDEYQSMRVAARARGGYQNYWIGMQSLGLILAQIFMRALDRAERVEQAMRVRGRDTVPPGAPHA